MHANCAKCTACKHIPVNGHSLYIADKAKGMTYIYLVFIIVDGGSSFTVLGSIWNAAYHARCRIILPCEHTFCSCYGRNCALSVT